MRELVIASVIVAVTGCGHTPSRLGVVLDEVGMSRSRLGPAPPDVFDRNYLPGTTTRIKKADLLGDGAPELLVEGTKGEGVEIRDQSGVLIKAVRTPDYLTDFGAIEATSGEKSSLVLYTYPNATKGGTFTVMNEALEPLAKWDENPAVGRFGTGEWAGQPALFYLQTDTLVVRSPSGAKLQELPAPEGRMFRDVFVQALGKGRLAVVVSGSGYTAYHMVCVYDQARLVFRQVETEHAYGIEPVVAGSGFVVTTRDSRWRYLFR